MKQLDLFYDYLGMPREEPARVEQQMQVARHIMQRDRQILRYLAHDNK